jgi:hypothetical protein
MTDAEQQFRAKQWALLPLIYSEDNAKSTAANAEYSANIASLTPEQLSGWHAGSVDPSAFELYSDCYKDENGIRPRSFITRANMQRWLEERRTAAPICFG